MSEMEMKIEVETQEFPDELSDEALDRDDRTEGIMSCGGNWCN